MRSLQQGASVRCLTSSSSRSSRNSSSAKQRCSPCQLVTAPRRSCSQVCRSSTQAAALPALQDLANATKVRLQTSRDCELAVSRYPMFSYNAEGGGGTGTVQQLGNNKLQLTFDAQELLIPALNWRTASVLGLPIPPPLNIAIRPNKFEGVLDLTTGQMDLEFSADFDFTVGSLYKAPSLKVATTLTSEHSAGQIHKADGQRLKDGQVKLVGVARVPEVSEAFLDIFLMLPTDALAVMRATLEFS